MKPDDFDFAILDVVARDNQLSHSEIGRRVSLSASSVRRRLIALRGAGVIERDVSVLSADKLGLTFIVHVWTNIEASKNDKQFRRSVDSDPAISQCYSVSGDFDYVLVVHTISADAYEAWSENALLNHPLVRRFTSTLVWSRVKYSMNVNYYESPDV